jgi:transcription factor CP2-like protein
MRVGFHERRLQYMEAEHISEWSLKHPSERILDIDLPLSYGVIDPIRDAGRLVFSQELLIQYILF